MAGFGGVDLKGLHDLGDARFGGCVEEDAEAAGLIAQNPESAAADDDAVGFGGGIADDLGLQFEDVAVADDGGGGEGGVHAFGRANGEGAAEAVPEACAVFIPAGEILGIGAELFGGEAEDFIVEVVELEPLGQAFAQRRATGGELAGDGDGDDG